MLKYIPVLAAAIMFTAFLIEYGIAIIKKSGIYELRDTITSVFTAVGYSVVTFFRNGILAGIFFAAYKISPWSWNNSNPWSWLLALGVLDFFYYWSHRLSHSVHFMWAFHAGHHSSRLYNLSLGLRNSWFGGFIDWIFIVPAFILGFDPLLVGAIIAIMQLWDFMCHMPYFGKISLLDFIFNSPSNHRVHHSSASEHLHCNFGGMFIIWDKIFRTYIPETVPLNYGLTIQPKHPNNPFYLQYFIFTQK